MKEERICSNCGGSMVYVNCKNKVIVDDMYGWLCPSCKVIDFTKEFQPDTNIEERWQKCKYCNYFVSSDEMENHIELNHKDKIKLLIKKK